MAVVPKAQRALVSTLEQPALGLQFALLHVRL